VNSQALSSNVVLTKTDIGLSNVDNTADTSKPVSTAQQTALNLKVDTATINTANGVAGLDASSKIAASQLPALSLGSSLSDVLVSTPADGQVLAYNTTSSKWINAAASGGGSANLAQTEIVVGVGDATTNPQTVTLRGPAGAGSNVAPGDLIIRAPAGTGPMGSGRVRFQTSSTPNIGAVASSYKSTTTASASATADVFLPPTTFSSNVSIVVCIVTTSAATVSSATISTTALTSFYSNIDTNNSTNVTYMYSPILSLTGAQTLTVNFSASTISSILTTVFENANASGATVVSYAFGAAASGEFSFSAKSCTAFARGDYILDLVLYGKNTTNNFDTIPATQFYVHRKTLEAASPYTTLSWSFKYAQAAGLNNMRRSSYSVSTTGTHYVMVVPSLRPASSTAETFQDSLIIDASGAQFLNNATTIFTRTTLNASTLLHYVTPSMRNIEIVSTLGSTSSYRTVTLPRADVLNIGTAIFVTGITSANTATNTNWYFVPFGSSLLINSTQVYGYVFKLGVLNTAGTLTPNAGAGYYNKVLFTLVDNSTPHGVWYAHWCNNTESNAGLYSVNMSDF
jgi:hypothetical protein